MEYRIKFKIPSTDISVLHRRVAYYFQNDLAVLWYFYGDTVWVRSNVEPVKELYPETKEVLVSKTYKGVREGELFNFRIKTNTVKRNHMHLTGKKRVTREMTNEEALAHLHKKAGENGFSVEHASILDRGTDVGNNRGNKVSLYYTELEGELKVEDLDLFNYALHVSIGRSGVHGMGMLRVEPIELFDRSAWMQRG